MKSIENLFEMIRAASWFSQLGQPVTADGIEIEQLANINAWESVSGLSADDPVPDIIERGMIWLPTQRDIPDPFYGTELEDASDARGKRKEYFGKTIEVYKETSKSLRGFSGSPKLVAGHNDFTEVAKQSALYAARRASLEILLERPGSWCGIIGLFCKGHWPCGLMPDGRLVVF